MCSKICTTKKNLREHIINVHGERIQCTKCEKSFSSKNNLKIHEKNKHGVDASICKICSKTCSITNIIQHEASCQRKFLKPINDHYVKSTNKSAKVQCKCSKCGKVYGNKERFENHKRACTGKKPVLETCNICDKSLKSSLERHIRIKHKVCMGTSENYLLVKEKVKPKVVISCHHCKKSFTRKYDLCCRGST